MKLLPSLSWFLVFHKCLSCSSHTSSHPESFFQNSLISWQENLLHSGKLGLDSIILVDPFQLTNSVVIILFLFFSVRSAVWQFASEFGFHLLIRCANLALITPVQQYQSQGILIFLIICLNFLQCFWTLLLGTPPAGVECWWIPHLSLLFWAERMSRSQGRAEWGLGDPVEVPDTPGRILGSRQEEESRQGQLPGCPGGNIQCQQITDPVGSRNGFIWHPGFALSCQAQLFFQVCGFSPGQVWSGEKQTQSTHRACLPEMGSFYLSLISHHKLGGKLSRFIFPPPERWIKGLKLHQQIVGEEWKEGRKESVNPCCMAEAARPRLLF